MRVKRTKHFARAAKKATVSAFRKRCDALLNEITVALVNSGGSPKKKYTVETSCFSVEREPRVLMCREWATVRLTLYHAHTPHLTAATFLPLLFSKRSIQMTSETVDISLKQPGFKKTTKRNYGRGSPA